MIGFYQGSVLPEQVKEGIYFIVDGNGKGKLYRVLAAGAASTNADLVAETSGAELEALQSAVSKNAEDISKNATSIAGALKTLSDITTAHGETLSTLSERVTAAQAKANDAAGAAATNATAIENNGKAITKNSEDIAAMKSGASITTFAGLEAEIAKKEAAGTAAGLIATATSELQSYATQQAQAEAKKVDDKLGFTATEEIATVVAYIDKKTEDMATSGTITDLQGRMSTAEGKISTLEGSVATKAEADNVYTKSEIDGKVQTINGAIAEKADADDVYTKQEIDNTVADINGKLTSAMHYKGTKATVEELEAVTEAAVGDVYNVAADGSNYAWDGSAWDKLAGVVDLSNYYTKSEADGLLGNKLDESEFNSTIANYSTTEQMNAALAEKAAKSVVDGLVETVGTKAAQSDLTALQGTVSTLSETVGTKAAQSDLNNAVGRIETAEGAIKTLTETTIPGINGEIDAVEKSIADEIAAREAAVKAEKEAREAADNAQVDRIAALETLLTWQPA